MQFRLQMKNLTSSVLNSSSGSGFIIKQGSLLLKGFETHFKSSILKFVLVEWMKATKQLSLKWLKSQLWSAHKGFTKWPHAEVRRGTFLLLFSAFNYISRRTYSYMSKSHKLNWKNKTGTFNKVNNKPDLSYLRAIFLLMLVCYFSTRCDKMGLSYSLIKRCPEHPWITVQRDPSPCLTHRSSDRKQWWGTGALVELALINLKSQRSVKGDQKDYDVRYK